ncbi:Intracisternal A-particle Pol-related polyprotein [Dictyocoela muelleri]|nr:Intracisternal A-particle Pol-related polyprotein [Dictyocoela muelleri]
MFAKFIRRKKSSEIIKLLDDIQSELKFEFLVSDNGTEYKNKDVRDWCRERRGNQKFRIPYFHEENGRIERTNRTLRNALNKESGKIKERLNKALYNYNITKQRRIGMSPNEALLNINLHMVIRNQEIYSREFGNKYLNNEYSICDKFFIKKEIRNSKADKEFETGEVIVRII